MNRKRTVIIAVVAALLLACTLAACVGSVIAGSALIAMSTYSRTRSPRWLEHHEHWVPTPQPLPRRQQDRPETLDIAALVVEVQEDGPAQEAGIKVGDFIVDVDGEPVEKNTNIRALLSGYEPGDRIDLTVWRAERERTIQVKLGRRGSDSPYLGLTYRMVPFPHDMD
jgi:membrane-associated protease RseP (regulator of RpoE activity)